MSSITVKIPDSLEQVLNDFCKQEERSKSWIIRKALAEKLEDWKDLRDGLKSLEKHKKNPKVISQEELIKKLGLTEEDLS